MARKCPPGQDYSWPRGRADFVGIAGIREPRKVVLILATEVRDKDEQ